LIQHCPNEIVPALHCSFAESEHRFPQSTVRLGELIANQTRHKQWCKMSGTFFVE